LLEEDHHYMPGAHFYLLRKILLSAALFSMAACSDVAPKGYEGPVSDHFDGKVFFNPWDPQAGKKGFFDLLKWRLSPKEGWTDENHEWPEWIDSIPGPKPADRVRQNLKVTWINHATVLIQGADLNILTDPVFSDRIGPVSWAGSKRIRDPGIKFEDLPKIDIVLISHNHYDHLDLPTLQRLEERDQPLVIAGLGNGAFLQARGIKRTMDVDWNQTVNIPNMPVKITALPAQHWSTRALWDRNRTLWVSYWLQIGEKSIYFSGDTGFGPHFQKIREKMGSPEVCLLPIGAYLPRWFMQEQHLNPDDAVRAFQILGGKYFFPIHFNTFVLADEGYGQAEEDLQTAFKIRKVTPEQLKLWKEGESYSPL
jgi:L-ascorbate metabolism protein UlaG (beta-lactamase superfamily)